MKVNTENTGDEWWNEILNDEGKYWEYWLVFLGNGSQNMLSILKNINFDVKSDTFTFSFSRCLPIFEKVVEVSRNSKQFCNLVLGVNYSE